MKKIKTIADLRPAPYNPREISPEAMAGLGASVERFGDLSGIVWNARSGCLVAGHQRLEALKDRGAFWNAGPPPSVELPENGAAFPVRVVDWDEETEKAANVAANSPLLSGVFSAELSGVLDDLGDFDEFDDLRFDELEIPQTDFDSKAADADAVPEAPEVPVTRLGDLWLCGGHRVLCGDSTSEAAVARALGQETPFLMVTDPPYGVEYDPKWRDEAAEHIGHAKRSTGEVENDDQADWMEAYALFPGAVAYVWHASVGAAQFAINLAGAGFVIRRQIVWAKPRFAISQGHYHWQHEPCWYAVRKGQTAQWAGDRSQSTLWEISNKIEDHTEHSTQKPVECMARPIRNHGKQGDSVYDPFLGSGTSLIAAEGLGRRCVGLELAPKYVDVIVGRWQAFAGLEATLEATGQTFAEVAGERA